MLNEPIRFEEVVTFVIIVLNVTELVFKIITILPAYI